MGVNSRHIHPSAGFQTLKGVRALPKKTFSYNSPKGTIHIEGPVSDVYLESLTMSDKLNNFRPCAKQYEALKDITNMPQGMIYIARHEKEIIGYVTFHYPDEYSRWIKHPRVLEMGGIEISSGWRRCGVAKNLLATAFSNPHLENFIVITQEFCWHWDLKNSGLDIFGYQKMLSGVFATVGMKVVGTDDPEICEHPANVLMARFGANVSKQDLMAFEDMRYMRRYGNAVNML
jgi:acetoin utilization protein AcuA